MPVNINCLPMQEVPSTSLSIPLSFAGLLAAMLGGRSKR